MNYFEDKSSRAIIIFFDYSHVSFIRSSPVNRMHLLWKNLVYSELLH